MARVPGLLVPRAVGVARVPGRGERIGARADPGKRTRTGRERGGFPGAWRAGVAVPGAVSIAGQFPGRGGPGFVVRVTGPGRESIGPGAGYGFPIGAGLSLIWGANSSARKFPGVDPGGIVDPQRTRGNRSGRTHARGVNNPPCIAGLLLTIPRAEVLTFSCASQFGAQFSEG